MTVCLNAMQTLAAHGGDRVLLSGTVPITSLNGGSDGISGSQGTDAVHNFSDDAADLARIVLVGIGAGVSVPFIHFPIFHEVTYE